MGKEGCIRVWGICREGTQGRDVDGMGGMCRGATGRRDRGVWVFLPHHTPSPPFFPTTSLHIPPIVTTPLHNPPIPTTPLHPSYPSHPNHTPTYHSHPSHPNHTPSLHIPPSRQIHINLMLTLGSARVELHALMPALSLKTTFSALQFHIHFQSIRSAQMKCSHYTVTKVN